MILHFDIHVISFLYFDLQDFTFDHVTYFLWIDLDLGMTKLSFICWNVLYYELRLVIGPAFERTNVIGRLEIVNYLTCLRVRTGFLPTSSLLVRPSGDSLRCTAAVLAVV